MPVQASGKKRPSVKDKRGGRTASPPHVIGDAEITAPLPKIAARQTNVRRSQPGTRVSQTTPLSSAPRPSVAGKSRATAAPPKPSGTALGNTPGNTPEHAPSASGSSNVPDMPNSRESTERRRPRAQAAQPKKMSKAAKIAASVIGVIVVAAIAVCGLLGWNQWLRYDDAADIQGTWYAAGTDTAITIDATSIKLTEDVSYTYELDPASKRIAFAFHNLSGEGRYRFSADRQSVAVIEGRDVSALSSFVEDAVWKARIVWGTITGNPVSDPAGGIEGAAVLTRTSQSEQAAAQAAQEAQAQAAAAAQAQAQGEGGEPTGKTEADSTTAEDAANEAGTAPAAAN